MTSTPTVVTQNGRRIPWHGLHDSWKYSQLKYILVIIQYILDIQYRELNSLKSPLSRTAQLQITQNYDRRGGGGPRKYLTLRRDRRTLLRRNVDVILQNFPKLQTEYVEMERRQGKVRLSHAAYCAGATGHSSELAFGNMQALLETFGQNNKTNFNLISLFYFPKARSDFCPLTDRWACGQSLHPLRDIIRNE